MSEKTPRRARPRDHDIEHDIQSYQHDKYSEYIQTYRRRHPDKVLRWRFNAALVYVAKYLTDHPDVAEQLHIDPVVLRSDQQTSRRSTDDIQR